MLLFVLLLLADEKPAVDAAGLKQLAGPWSFSSLEHGGEKAPKKELDALAYSVAGEKVVVREGKEIKEESSVVLLDPSAKPARIDLRITSGDDKGKLVKGIYRLDGQTLTVCVAEPGRDRPAAFAAARGSGNTLMTLARKKE